MKEGYEHQIDCMYGAATALYLLGDYAEARVSLISGSIILIVLRQGYRAIFTSIAMTSLDVS